MLTQQDLQKLEQLLEAKFQQSLEPVKKDIQSIYDILDNFDTRLSTMDILQREMLVTMSKIRKDQLLSTKFFDKEYVALNKRVDRVEDHLDLTPLEQ